MIDLVIETLGNIIYLLVALEIIFIIFLLFAERADPNKVVVWVLVFLLIPIFGFFVYLLIGQTFYSDHTFKLKSIKDDEIKRLYELEEKIIEDDEMSDFDPESIKFARTIRTMGGTAYTTNNDITLYTLGQDKFDQMFEDLRNAERTIHLEYYIIRDDELGNEFMDILIQKIKEGVEVKLLTDAFGIGKGPKKAINAFRKAGGEYALFHNVFMLALSPKKNNRNHRKIAIIDGDIGYCGGFNVGDEYLGKGELGFWRDSAVRIRGGGCVSLEMRFELDWSYASGKEIEINKPLYFPNSCSNRWGDCRMQIISGGPDIASTNPVRMQYLEMIRTAKKTVYLHSPYFIPSDSLSDELKLAAARGVDVRVIIPDKPDHMFVYWNNISSANQVMKGGIRVFMYNNGFVHSKTMVVDGKYCSVGSANFDDRSLVLNFESNAMIYSEDIGKQMDDAFAEDLKHCTEYSCAKYDERTLSQKIRIGISKLFRNLS